MTKEQLYTLACTARDNAYAPYSHFLVGCALLTNDGAAFSGCNYENISYGATICAERNAVGAAIQNGMAKTDKHFIKEIVIVSQTEKPAPPCGLCLQVLSEFSLPETPVHLANLKGIQTSLKIKDFLPHQFSSLS